MKKGGTYFDKIMKDKEFKELFEKEYVKVLISEKRAKMRKETKRKLSGENFMVANCGLEVV